MLKAKNLENVIFCLILFGILLLSLGIGLIKINGRIGSSLIIISSGMIYVGVVFLALVA